MSSYANHTPKASPPSTTVSINSRAVYYSAFSTHAAARRWADGMPKRGAVVHGASGQFWTVLSADAERMERAGYTVASW